MYNVLNRKHSIGRYDIINYGFVMFSLTAYVELYNAAISYLSLVIFQLSSLPDNDTTENIGSEVCY